MNKAYYSILLVLSVVHSAVLVCATEKQPTEQAQSPFKTHRIVMPQGTIVTNPLDLLAVAQQVYEKITQPSDTSTPIQSAYGSINSCLYPNYNAYIKSTQKTLRFIIDCIRRDAPWGKFRILDPSFLAAHFRPVAWHGTDDKETPRIRLTKYVVYHALGNYCKTQEFTHALYATPADELRTLYKRGEIINGALDDPKHRRDIRPLMWLKKEDFLQASLQGTTIVHTPDHTSHVLKVHEHNSNGNDGVSPRNYYWFFKRVAKLPPGIHRWEDYLDVVPEVTLAGDLQNIGLGQLVLLNSYNRTNGNNDLRLGIIADTGGAFVNNNHQLDFFAGVFKNPAEFYQKTRHISDYPETYILLKK